MYKSRIYLFKHHVVNHLARYFSEYLLCEFFNIRIILEFHKLHKIPHSCPPICSPQYRPIGIQFSHHFESFFAHSDNNDTQRQLRSVNKQVLGLRHVMNFTVSQYQQYRISVFLSLTCSQYIQLLLNNRSEIRRSTE